MGKAKLLIIISLVIVFCFVPMINMPYEVVAQKQVSEEYTTVEPYTVQEEVREVVGGRNLYSLERGHYWEPIYRTVLKDVIKYREVTKTRLVYRPVVQTRTKRVSILRYLLR